MHYQPVTFKDAQYLIIIRIRSKSLEFIENRYQLEKIIFNAMCDIDNITHWSIL